MIFGVWDQGTQVISGALGTSYPGVPANRSMHFRIGNVTETFETTLLLQLVDRGKIFLDDPCPSGSWFVARCEQGATGRDVGLQYLGVASFYTAQWTAEFDADPFQA